MFENVKHIKYQNIHGVLESIQPFEEVEIETSIGKLIPVYKVEDQGRKKLTPVTYDSEGKIKSLQLQNPLEVKTSIGKFSTEFITFYPTGEIRRLFQLNGKLSGYWSEKNEYELAKTINIPTPLGNINVKPIYVHFYKSGNLKSITFWPQEKVNFLLKDKEISLKTGISFYESGALKSYEPLNPVMVSSPIGDIEAFDPDPLGINGEQNSLRFTEDGTVAALSTIKSQVSIIDECGIKQTYSPIEVASRCSDTTFVIQPLKIEFTDSNVIFKHGFRTIGKGSIKSIFNIEMFESKNAVLKIKCCS